jgi:hypothetical protein
MGPIARLPEAGLTRAGCALPDAGAAGSRDHAAAASAECASASGSEARLTAADRLLFLWLCRLFPSLRNTITIVQPNTVLRWHRSGFRLCWRWKSPSRGGRPKVPIEVRSPIGWMSLETRYGRATHPW